MCFIGYKNNVIVADKDIKCYKCLQRDFRSPCYNKLYYLGENISSPLKPYGLGDGFKAMLAVNQGLHSYVSSVRAIKRAKEIGGWYNRTLGVGDSPVVVECIIPKGSSLYYNGLEYVSDNLTPMKVIFDRNNVYNK